MAVIRLSEYYKLTQVEKDNATIIGNIVKVNSSVEIYDDWLHRLAEYHNVTIDRVSQAINNIVLLAFASTDLEANTIELYANRLRDLQFGLHRLWLEDKLKMYFIVFEKLEPYTDRYAIELGDIQYFAGNGVTEIEL